MNKFVIGGLIIGLAVVLVAGLLLFQFDREPAPTVQDGATTGTVSRPAVRANPNTFNIMTPEEKAAADAAAALATTEATASTSNEEAEVEANLEGDVTDQPVESN